MAVSADRLAGIMGIPQETAEMRAEALMVLAGMDEHKLAFTKAIETASAKLGRSDIEPEQLADHVVNTLGILGVIHKRGREKFKQNRGFDPSLSNAEVADLGFTSFGDKGLDADEEWTATALLISNPAGLVFGSGILDEHRISLVRTHLPHRLPHGSKEPTKDEGAYARWIQGTQIRIGSIGVGEIYPYVNSRLGDGEFTTISPRAQIVLAASFVKN